MIQVPYAWAVEVPGTKPEVFLDFGRALVVSIQRGGTIVTLYKGTHHPEFVPKITDAIQ